MYPRARVKWVLLSEISYFIILPVCLMLRLFFADCVTHQRFHLRLLFKDTPKLAIMPKYFQIIES